MPLPANGRCVVGEGVGSLGPSSSFVRMTTRTGTMCREIVIARRAKRKEVEQDRDRDDKGHVGRDARRRACLRQGYCARGYWFFSACFSSEPEE